VYDFYILLVDVSRLLIDKNNKRLRSENIHVDMKIYKVKYN